MTLTRALLHGVGCLLLLTACTGVGDAARDTSRDPEQLVRSFYEQALGKRQVRAAFERCAASSFVEHKPDVPDGTREATIRYLEDLVAGVPDGRWDLLRVVAEGDLVALHVKFVPAPGAPAYAIADFFRVQDGLIVEHWDVVGRPVLDQANPNPRF